MGFLAPPPACHVSTHYKHSQAASCLYTPSTRSPRCITSYAFVRYTWNSRRDRIRSCLVTVAMRSLYHEAQPSHHIEPAASRHPSYCPRRGSDKECTAPARHPALVHAGDTRGGPP